MSLFALIQRACCCGSPLPSQPCAILKYCCWMRLLASVMRHSLRKPSVVCERLFTDRKSFFWRHMGTGFSAGYATKPYGSIGENLCNTENLKACLQRIALKLK